MTCVFVFTHSNKLVVRLGSFGFASLIFRLKLGPFGFELALPTLIMVQNWVRLGSFFGEIVVFR